MFQAVIVLSSPPEISASPFGWKLSVRTMPRAGNEPIKLASLKLYSRTILSAPAEATRLLLRDTATANTVSVAPGNVRSALPLVTFHILTALSSPAARIDWPFGTEVIERIGAGETAIVR